MIGKLFSIIIGFSLFMLTWNSRRIIDNDSLIFIGIAFFFIAGIDLIHTLAYKGIDLVAGYGDKPADPALDRRPLTGELFPVSRPLLDPPGIRPGRMFAVYAVFSRFC